VLYGKAPGNIFYRAAALILGMALGNFICVNGSVLATTAFSSSNNSDSEGGLVAILFAAAIGVGIMVVGYRTFRYGEEIEKTKRDARKLVTEQSKQLEHLFGGNPTKMLKDVVESQVLHR
ncbi:MAG: hypothetical protein AAF485_27030, partial [Chloroflexota bacterium]